MTLSEMRDAGDMGRATFKVLMVQILAVRFLALQYSKLSKFNIFPCSVILN